MSIVVNTNVSALLAQNYLTNNQAGLSQAVNRLSSGLRINDASDDPAGLAISTTMATTSAALTQGARNGNDGISLLQTAQSAMNDISNLLQQMNGLASQASSGTYSSSNLTNVNTEFTALLSEINRVASSVSFNGINLLDGSTSSISIQVGSGDTSFDRLSISLSNLTTGSAGLNISSLDVSNNTNAQAALSALATALETVTTDLAGIGASESNLTAAVNNDNAISAELNAAKSRILDADYALESSNLSKFNILNQSNIAMLAQANSNPQMVLQLLRG